MKITINSDVYMELGKIDFTSDDLNTFLIEGTTYEGFLFWRKSKTHKFSITKETDGFYCNETGEKVTDRSVPTIESLLTYYANLALVNA